MTKKITYRYIVVSAWGWGASTDLKEAIAECEKVGEGFPDMGSMVFKVSDDKDYIVSTDAVFNKDDETKARCYDLTDEEIALFQKK